MEYIKIGKIINTFGIKGELKLDVYTDFINERFKKDSLVYVGEDKIAFTIKNYKIHNDFLLIQSKDNENINLVEKYKNMYVYKSKDDVKPLKEGEYYFSDLINLNVFVDDKQIGKVIKVESGISSNYLRVKINNDEKLVPFLPAFILKVDLINRRIDIKNIEGLL